MKTNKNEIKNYLENFRNWIVYLKNHNHKPKNEKDQNELDEINDEIKITISFLNDLITSSEYTNYEKWKPIIEAYNVTDEKVKIFMAEYAEYYQKVVRINGDSSVSSLPISLKILSKLNLNRKFKRNLRHL